MEENLSMPELTSILEAKREQDYNEKKFLAALQGVDLDKENKQDAWENLKNRVFNNTSNNANDITSLKGRAAAQAGFGIGAGLDYEVM